MSIVLAATCILLPLLSAVLSVHAVSTIVVDMTLIPPSRVYAILLPRLLPGAILSIMVGVSIMAVIVLRRKTPWWLILLGVLATVYTGIAAGAMTDSFVYEVYMSSSIDFKAAQAWLSAGTVVCLLAVLFLNRAFHHPDPAHAERFQS